MPSKHNTKEFLFSQTKWKSVFGTTSWVVVFKLKTKIPKEEMQGRVILLTILLALVSTLVCAFDYKNLQGPPSEFGVFTLPPAKDLADVSSGIEGSNWQIRGRYSCQTELQ